VLNLVNGCSVFNGSELSLKYPTECSKSTFLDTFGVVELCVKLDNLALRRTLQRWLINQSKLAMQTALDVIENYKSGPPLDSEEEHFYEEIRDEFTDEWLASQHVTRRRRP